MRERILILSSLSTFLVGTIGSPAQAFNRFSEYPIQPGAGPQRIVTDPDENLWFTESGGSIGKITTQGPSPNTQFRPRTAIRGGSPSARTDHDRGDDHRVQHRFGPPRLHHPWARPEDVVHLL